MRENKRDAITDFYEMFDMFLGHQFIPIRLALAFVGRPCIGQGVIKHSKVLECP